MDCVLNEYEPVYFNAPIHHLNTVTVESLNHPKSEPHIRPLWFSQESSSQIFQIDCEVDTGASCNILPFYKAKALFGNDLKLGKPTVNLKGYNDSPVENLGSWIVYLYHGNKIFRVLCEVADSKGHMILGRKQALIMEYVNFPEIQKPAVQAKTDRSIKTLVVVADALSRVSPQPTPKEGEDEEDFTPVHMLTEEIPADSMRVGDFRRATAEDTISSLLMQVVANGWPELKKDCHPLLVDYWSYREEISAENGLLFKGHRLIVPEKLRSRVLQTIHEGHFGFEKMQLRAREAVFWPGITSDLLQAAQGCEVRQTFSRSQQRETLLPHEVPQGPWEKLGIEIFEFQSTTYLLIADY